MAYSVRTEMPRMQSDFSTFGDFPMDGRANYRYISCLANVPINKSRSVCDDYVFSKKFERDVPRYNDCLPNVVIWLDIVPLAL